MPIDYEVGVQINSDGYIEFFFSDNKHVIWDYEADGFNDDVFAHLARKDWFTNELEDNTRKLVNKANNS